MYGYPEISRSKEVPGLSWSVLRPAPGVSGQHVAMERLCWSAQSPLLGQQHQHLHNEADPTIRAGWEAEEEAAGAMNLWLLREGTGPRGRETGTGKAGPGLGSTRIMARVCGRSRKSGVEQDFDSWDYVITNTW